MLGFKSKSASKREPVYVVVYRSPAARGFEETATHEQAMEAFQQCVGLGHFSPDTRRRIFVAGPDYCVQPDDPTDPLLIGPAALRAVLSDEEYAALPQVRLAESLVVAL